jgi:hypothetical protein
MIGMISTRPPCEPFADARRTMMAGEVTVTRYVMLIRLTSLLSRDAACDSDCETQTHDASDVRRTNKPERMMTRVNVK